MSQAIEYGAAVFSVPRLTPSSLNCTPATPTLSLAVAVTVTVDDTLAPAAGAVTVTAGAVVSATAGVVNVESLETARFPAASRDRTRK